MINNYSWRSAIKSFLLFIFPWGLIGWLLGYLPEFLLAAAVCIIVWQYYHQRLLYRWLWLERSLNPPSASGTWGSIFDGIYSLQKKNRSRRKQLGLLIKRFREGAEALPDATLMFDDENHILWSNKLARKTLGIKKSDVGYRIDNLIRNPDFEKYQKVGDFSEPVIIPSPKNAHQVLEIRLIPYAEKQMLFIARDVTKLTQLESMRQDFVANVSHELRTPLTVLQGYLEMMEDVADMPIPILQKAQLEMMKQTSRMSGLVEQLLVLSKIESGNDDIFANECNLSSVIGQIRHEAETLNKEKSHQLKFDIAEDLRVNGIEVELRSAMSNLVFNAIHYTAKNGLIEVNLSKTECGVLFEVIDNGEGIAKKHLKRITERFYRADEARSRATGGSGLGLSIVKHVLARHHSELEIDSQLGQGSRFAFRLPDHLITQ